MYLTHKDLSKYIVIDIETDDLNATRIHCIVCKNIGTHASYNFRNDHSFVSFVRSQPSDITWIGHNALSFDVPIINRLTSAFIPPSRVIDTLTLSLLYNPRLDGHSLEDYGHRFGIKKQGLEVSFKEYSQELLERCKSDVEITEKVFLVLTRKMRARGFSEKSCELEHRIREVVNEQQENGFYFDVDEAVKLHGQIVGRREGLTVPISALFPRRLKDIQTYSRRIKKDGSDFASYIRHCETYPKITRRGQEYTVWDWETFNIGSPQQRLNRLRELGYTNHVLTKGGLPKVDEEGVLAFMATEGGAKHREALQAIGDWLVCQGRSTMLKGNPDYPGKPTRGWIDYFNPDTHCIHGVVNTCGAGSRRMTHMKPNTANAPKADPKVQYGKEMRGLWQARPNRVLVGYDAKGLEMRTFAHEVGTKEVAELYINGDPHAVNANMLGVDRSPTAKTLFYGFIYGAQDSKLGSVVGKTRDHGAWIRSRLFEAAPGLEDCIRRIKSEFTQNEGWLSCIDGGYVRCPSEHAVLNYKCQPSGAILMKQASIFLHERIKSKGLDALKVGDIHDEGQLDCSSVCADEVGKLAVGCIRDAGEELDFSVPMDGDYKIGRTWSQTH